MVSKQKILIVDDDEHIAELISLYLTKECFDTRIEHDGQSAITAFKEYMPDVVLLDIMLPGKDGYQVCREIRMESNVPIIMLSAKTEVFDKVLGLELGADDYITKPFSVRELVARVKANLRKVDASLNSKTIDDKQEKKKESKISVGDLELDLDKFEVKVRGEVIDLTLREFEVLKFLASEPGQVVTRETLLEKVWGYEYYGDIRTVDVTVRRIREKIEKDTSTPQILITKRGVGYYIVSK